MSKKVLIPIADGVEEMETVTQIDILRRAGAKVTVAAVKQLRITASRGVILTADKLIVDCKDELWDLITLPGGMPGAKNLADCQMLIDLLRKQKQANKLYGAICASPALVFYPQGLLDGLTATCYPSFASKLPNRSNDRVVIDQNCITSQGPGTSIEYSLTLVELLYDKTKSQELAETLVA